jgi:hypothetical protein
VTQTWRDCTPEFGAFDRKASLRIDKVETLAYSFLEAHSLKKAQLPEKRFCPHVARVFFMVDPERARSVLSLIHACLADWKFESKLAVEFPT